MELQSIIIIIIIIIIIVVVVVVLQSIIVITNILRYTHAHNYTIDTVAYLDDMNILIDKYSCTAVPFK